MVVVRERYPIDAGSYILVQETEKRSLRRKSLHVGIRWIGPIIVRQSGKLVIHGNIDGVEISPE